MTAPRCPREDDLLAAILEGRWADQCDRPLHEHAARCEVCRSLVEVASMIRDERRSLDEHVNVPSAGQVWWRSAIRARLEATQAASRPMAWMFGTAGACAIGLAVALVGVLWPSVQQVSWSSLQAWSDGLVSSGFARMLSEVAWTSGLLALGAVTCIVLAPLALYLALSDD